MLKPFQRRELKQKRRTRNALLLWMAGREPNGFYRW